MGRATARSEPDIRCCTPFWRIYKKNIVPAMTPANSPSPDAISSHWEPVPICGLILFQFQIIIGIAKSMGINIEGVTFKQVHRIIVNQTIKIPAIVSLIKSRISHFLTLEPNNFSKIK